MADKHHDAGHGDHGNLFKLYMFIALVLAVCTASSFLFNWMGRSDIISLLMAFLLILGVAILKATLVGMYFMHLKWDWKFLYFLIVPVFIMGTMMAVVLLPDILIGPNRDMADALQLEKLAAEQIAKGKP